MIQKNQCLFTNTQCKVCCALLISESQKLAHYQVCPCTLVLSRPNAKPPFLSVFHSEFLLSHPDVASMHVGLIFDLSLNLTDCLNLTDLLNFSESHFSIQIKIIVLICSLTAQCSRKSVLWL